MKKLTKKPKKAEWYVEKKYWVKDRTDYALLHTLLDMVYQAFLNQDKVWILGQPKPRKKSK